MAAKKTRSSKSKPRRSKAAGATVAAGPRKDTAHRRAAAPKTSALPRAPRAATPELRAEQPSVHHALLSEVARGTDAHSVERAPRGLLARAWSGARSLVLRALCFA